MYYVVCSHRLLCAGKVIQGETVISHVKNSPGQGRSGATLIIDTCADQHVCNCFLEHVQLLNYGQVNDCIRNNGILGIMEF